MVIVVDFSGYTWGEFLRKKSEATGEGDGGEASGAKPPMIACRRAIQLTRMFT